MMNSKINSCTITDDWTYKGMKTVFLENNLLRVGILVDRGSDIFEFRYKPLDLDPLLRLPSGIRNPSNGLGPISNPESRFEEFYYGGWQEVLPNSPVFNYRGAVLGKHGEVSLVSWNYRILKDNPDEVQLKVWIDLVKMPLRLEKIFSLKKDEARVYISERLTNRGNITLDIMWGHHIAFGLPFLAEGAEIDTNAKIFTADTEMLEPKRFTPGKEYPWPNGKNIKGEPDDASCIPDVNSEKYSDLCYLEGFPEKAFYTIKSKGKDIAFNLNWSEWLFKCLWLWQERKATQGFPWWGGCYTVALEPWTSAGTSDPEKAIAKSEWLKIAAGESITTELDAGFMNVTKYKTDGR